MAAMTGQIAFISGASAGFGAALARRLSAMGASLVLAARRLDRLQSLAAGLPGPTHCLALDVRDAAAVAAAVAGLPADFAALSILVNNAGLALGTDPAPKASLADWQVMVDTNITGLMALTHAVLPGMVARNRGHIVNLGSVAARYPYPGGNAYCGTKAFVRQFSLALRADLLGSQVRVTCIEPGMAETEFSVVRFKGDADKAAAVYRGVDALSAEDIADTVIWALDRPPHVNVNMIELMPTQQAFSPFAVHRRA